MKVVILAGGMGTRLSEETDVRPKPMVEIGGKPILWHIMKLYSHYGFNDFVICLGYKGYIIKEFFTNYYLHQSDIKVDLENNNIEYYNSKAEPWKISLVDTGTQTMTGGRIKRIQEYIGNETFMLTYGDGVANINIEELQKLHNSHGKYVTMTAIQPSGKFGALDIDDNNKVASFQEKPKGDGSWINGGFFVLEPEIFDYIENDETSWERKPLEKLSAENQVYSYKHKGFWQCMDTIHNKLTLEKLWRENKADWKIWK